MSGCKVGDQHETPCCFVGRHSQSPMSPGDAQLVFYASTNTGDDTLSCFYYGLQSVLRSNVPTLQLLSPDATKLRHKSVCFYNPMKMVQASVGN
jgi:hypothetical protein